MTNIADVMVQESQSIIDLAVSSPESNRTESIADNYPTSGAVSSVGG